MVIVGSLGRNRTRLPQTAQVSSKGLPVPPHDIASPSPLRVSILRKSLPRRRVSNTDIAPTMAEVLGVKMPEMEGRVLSEMLAWQ